TVREFYTCKQEEGQSVSSYVLKMKSYIDHLERLGHLVTLNLGVQKNKNKKPSKAAKGVQGKGKGKIAYANAAPSYAPKPKNPPPPKKDSPAKDAICHHCGEVGCGTHICNTTQGLRGSKKLNLGALSLYIGNGQREAVKAIGNYHLCLPSGLVIVLNNCHYAPSITRGIILVSRFAIIRDGVYEIEMPCSNTNDSSMYVVSNKRAKLNLDPSLLWHCRLGHISKKRIEKLQYDGLLNSTDIESLGKCVSCMSRKMARKPYSHQVERAKDLLGIMHTDVRGPFRIMSRQGANYFITFTDDFSRQTTLPKSFWNYALKSAARILNMVSTKKVDKTPYKIWHGQAPKLLRYPKETMEYSFYNPSENKVFVARNAEFFESNLIDQEARGSLEDLEIIQEKDTNPSLDTSLNHEKDDQEINEPQSDINPIRRSSRIKRTPNRMCLYIDAEEHKLGDLDEPANYKAALLDLESKKWLATMNVEMQSMKDNDV
ncbi:retrotransposon protein, putative, ty1-copia subclass, partial [Tanacetum coccineum]